MQVCKQPGGDGTLVPDQGVIIAVKNGATERLMPFASNQTALPAAALVTDKEVTRTLGACTDRWDMPLGVSWTHYTPVWAHEGMGHGDRRGKAPLRPARDVDAIPHRQPGRQG